MTAAVTFSWYFILGPVMQQGTETTLAKAVSSATHWQASSLSPA